MAGCCRLAADSPAGSIRHGEHNKYSPGQIGAARAGGECHLASRRVATVRSRDRATWSRGLFRKLAV